jgi:hypothetical protein
VARKGECGIGILITLSRLVLSSACSRSVRTKPPHANFSPVRTDPLEPLLARSERLSDVEGVSARKVGGAEGVVGARGPRIAGRFRPLARIKGQTAGAAVVPTHQHTGPGVWFLVRLTGLVAAPILVPVLESHIRRHPMVRPPWPDHDPDCDFFRDHREQPVIARSFTRYGNGRAASLGGRLSATGMKTRAASRVAGRSYAQPRGTLATALMQLIDAAR